MVTLMEPKSIFLFPIQLATLLLAYFLVQIGRVYYVRYLLFSLKLFAYCLPLINGLRVAVLSQAKLYQEVLSVTGHEPRCGEVAPILLHRSIARRNLGFMDQATLGDLQHATQESLWLFKGCYVFRWIAYLRELKIATRSELEEINIYFSYERWSFCRKSWIKARLELAAAWNELGESEVAQQLCVPISNRTALIDAYLPLRLLLDNFRPQAKRVSQDLKINFQGLSPPGHRLKKMILDAQGSICIVGNAPNVIGSCCGSQIDAHRLVIRFNNYSTDAPYAIDVGSRTDIWVRMLPTSLITRNADPALRLIIFTGANTLNRPITKWHYLADLIRSGYSIDFFIPEYFFELQEILGAPPSSGLMICYTIYRINGSLSKSSVYGLSMDGSAGKASNYHYSDPNAFAAPRHHWEKEKAIFDMILE